LHIFLSQLIHLLESRFLILLLHTYTQNAFLISHRHGGSRQLGHGCSYGRQKFNNYDNQTFYHTSQHDLINIDRRFPQHDNNLALHYKSREIYYDFLQHDPEAEFDGFNFHHQPLVTSHSASQDHDIHHNGIYYNYKIHTYLNPRGHLSRHYLLLNLPDNRSLHSHILLPSDLNNRTTVGTNIHPSSSNHYRTSMRRRNHDRHRIPPRRLLPPRPLRHLPNHHLHRCMGLRNHYGRAHKPMAPADSHIDEYLPSLHDQQRQINDHHRQQQHNP
jgi:hypothetical protein